MSPLGSQVPRPGSKAEAVRSEALKMAKIAAASQELPTKEISPIRFQAGLFALQSSHDFGATA